MSKFEDQDPYIGLLIIYGGAAVIGILILVAIVVWDNLM